jgi:5'-nucleotidase
MTSLGFDAMAVGNHEFDAGPDVLEGVLETAFAGGSFPILSANLDMSAFPDLKQLVHPSNMKGSGDQSGKGEHRY